MAPMSAASTAAVRPQPAFTRLTAAMASRPLWVALAVTAIITALRLVDTVDSDVAWQLWIAQRIHAGAHLYRDIIEVNPPLWFWMAIPVERVAALLHLPIVTVLIVAIGLVVGLSLSAANRLIDDFSPARRTVLLAFAAVTLVAMPWMHTGQREQIVLIGTLPYAALIAARAQGKRVPVLLAVFVGGGAALGFALKHYFLIVPALLELWLLATLRRDYRPVRPETVAIAVTGLVYAAAIVIFAPQWLTHVVPLIRLAYGATGAPGIAYLFGPFTVVALLILAMGASQYKRLAGSPRPAALLVAAAGFAAAYFMQAKGWPYHAIPIIGCASLALVVILGAEGAPRLLGLIGPALLAFPLFLAADDEMHPALPSPDLLQAVSGLNHGDSVGFLATEPALAWSISLQQGYRFPSRYMGFWMMNAIVRNEAMGGPDPRLTALGRQIVTETVQDFRCAPPKRIIVWRPRPGQQAFDILPFFLRDPQFAELLSHYRARSRTSLQTYDQLSPLPPPRSTCRTGI
jgi:hypothetical protein